VSQQNPTLACWLCVDVILERVLSQTGFTFHWWLTCLLSISLFQSLIWPLLLNWLLRSYLQTIYGGFNSLCFMTLICIRAFINVYWFFSYCRVSMFPSPVLPSWFPKMGPERRHHRSSPLGTLPPPSCDRRTCPIGQQNPKAELCSLQASSAHQHEKITTSTPLYTVITRKTGHNLTTLNNQPHKSRHENIFIQHKLVWTKC